MDDKYITMSITVIIYIIFICLFMFALKSESLDIFCPKGCKLYTSDKCGDGKGKYYKDSRGSPEDSVRKLLDKLETLSDVPLKTVNWRRCFILTCVIVLLYSLLITNTLPNYKNLLLMLLIPFIVFYGSFSFYNQHYLRFIAGFSKENISIIRKKLKLNNSTNKIII